MPLAKLEKSFVSNLMLSDSAGTEFLSVLVTTGNLSVDKQLDIYIKNISGAYQKVLAQIYPACLNILGEEYFNQLCQLYRIKHPSTEADLNLYGDFFSSFLKEQIELRHELEDFEYLEELSLLEWHWHKSYFVKDDSVFNFEKLAMLNQDEQGLLIFKLSYAFFLHSSAYPLLDIWNSNKKESSEQQEFILPEKNINFCVFRKRYKSETQVLSELQFNILNDMSKNIPLSKLSSRYNEILQTELNMFIKQGWVTGFTCSNHNQN